MLENALREEFDCWLDNTEWTDNQMKLLDELERKEKDEIVEKVLMDEEFTQEMFRCFEWYLNRYMNCKDDRWCS